MEAKKLKELKKGEWFILKPIEYPKETQVYIKDDYCREEKKYICGKWYDCGYSRLIKGDTPVYTDFTF